MTPTKFTAVLVKRLEDQQDDDYRIDPAGVHFDEEPVPLWREFNYRVPEDLMGHGVVRMEDGQLVVDGEIEGLTVKDGEFFPPMKLAIGVRSMTWRPGETITESDLMSIGVTHAHKDPSQPVIRPIEI